MNFLRNLALTLLGLVLGAVVLVAFLLSVFYLVDGCILWGCK